MRRQKQQAKTRRAAPRSFMQGARFLWSGTLSFGLVSIPVDLLSAVRPRQTAMKLIDTEGHALGRQYHCAKDGRKLDDDDLVRGYETEDGNLVVITDEDFASAAPEMSADLSLRSFVPAGQIPLVYFQKSYFLSPGGKSATAYNLLAATMKRTGRAGIGSFVMRGQEYLAAIVADDGVLRADTLRYADEIRSPADIGLPDRRKSSSKRVNQFIEAIKDLKRDKLELAEMEDQELQALQDLARRKKRDRDNVIRQPGLEEEEPEAAGQTAQIIDLTEVLRRSLSKRAVVTHLQSSAPISLDERRAAKTGAARKAAKRSRQGRGKARVT